MEHGEKIGDTWWVSTKDFLPTIGERVLIISKFGHISDSMFTDFDLDRPPRFEPSGFEPNVDVKWWMQIPTDGWHKLSEEQPAEGQKALTMSYYGYIYNGVWKRSSYEREPCFHPVVREVLFWRELPELPDGVTLKY